MSCDHGYVDRAECGYCDREMILKQAHTFERIAAALEQIAAALSKKKP